MFPIFEARWLGCFLTVAALQVQPAVAQVAPAGPTAVVPAGAIDELRTRAFDAAVWGMPIVSVDAMREAYFRDAGARYNDIVYWSRPADWNNQTTTPNSSSLYVYFNFNLKDGPVVVDLPAADGIGVFGGLIDAWQVPLTDVGPAGQDQGKGGRYLLLPPGFKGEVPPGYIPLRSTTNNGYALIRVTSKTLSRADLDTGNAYIHKLRVTAFSDVSGGAQQRFIDMNGKLFDGIVRFDDTYFVRLARMVNEEPALPRDARMYASVRALGIEPGRAFTPDAATRARLRAAAQLAHASFRQALLAGEVPWWPGSRWGINSQVIQGVKTGFTFDDGQRLDIGARAAVFYFAYAPPQKLGKATFYLTGWRDDRGELFEGSGQYRLRVPPRVPAREFWAVNVYDSETCGFIRRAPRVGLDSYDKGLQRNADGSIDIYFGPQPPAGKAANWIYTAPGKPWFVGFRLYGPGAPILDKSWRLPDVVRQ
ncbi:putative lipoprotein [Caballeronia hypogeia]|uniref:Lipoprotein n=1 Tax=Caballeronia hypogeia TaxID=1777140 RepID=A0A158CV20_9BURK|nr:DUF1214 domain-containing protein [Caballeronia hypogeia]SAK86168.1 putative lipoprotein [Caballeronia hypogeia]